MQHKRKNLFTKAQKKQVYLQHRYMQHAERRITMPLPLGKSLRDLVIYPGVWDPTRTVSRYCASYLLLNNARLFKDKRVLDMGTGTGILGIVAGLYGARRVVFSDISSRAVANTKENISNFGLEKKTKVFRSDVFEVIPRQKFDLIVFNHPFFSGTPKRDDSIAASMLDTGNLLRRFLRDAKKYLGENGVIAMPFYSKAGSTNDPSVKGPLYGYKTEIASALTLTTGLQQGGAFIYELILKKKKYMK